MMHLELIIRVNEIAAERGEREARSVLAAGMILRHEPADTEGDAGTEIQEDI